MLLKKTFKFRLNPTREQEHQFLQFAGAKRWLYNWGLEQRKTAWEQGQQSISLFAQQKALTLLKADEKTSWLREVHSQVLQQALQDLDHAYVHFFRRLKSRQGQKAGYPRFKRRGEWDSFRYPQGVRAEEDRAWLPKIGWVRFRKSREIEGAIKQTTIVRSGNGWEICFSCEQEVEVATIKTHDPAGIDLGLEHFAVVATAEGETLVENPRFLRRDLRHLRFLSRQVSKKQIRSSNREKAKVLLRIAHTKVRNRRNDFLHKLSTQLVENQVALAAENLAVTAMLTTSSRSLSREIGGVGWRQFLEMLRYKSLHAGKAFVEVDRYFPSSQICSACHGKAHMPLDQRIYRCECGLVLHRDINSARIIRAAGTSVLKSLWSCLALRDALVGVVHEEFVYRAALFLVLLHRSGGNIAFAVLGVGTTFKIYLPRVVAPVETPQPMLIPAPQTQGSETILLVEDEDSIRSLVLGILQSHGYTVLEAGRPQDALEICKTFEGPIHLLFTDVVMPHMSGREVAEQVSAARPNTKVLYMSGYTDHAIAHHGVLNPGVPFLQKPFTPDLLAQKVREGLDMVPSSQV